MTTAHDNRQRIEHLDIARGIAILSVIFGHMGRSAINRVVFTYHLPIFYFITGYFTDRKLSVWEFARKKARTLLQPYFVTCAMICVLAVLLALHYHGDVPGQLIRWVYASLYGAGDSYTKPFYIPSIGAIWFLWGTFWGSLLLRILLERSEGFRGCAVLLIFFVSRFTRRFLWMPLSVQAGGCALLFMYMGYLFRRVKPMWEQIPHEGRAGLFCLLFFAWVYFIRTFTSFWLVHADVGRGAIDIIGCVGGCWTLLLLSRFLSQKTPFLASSLSFLGRNSLLVLCMHIIELNLFPWDWIYRRLPEHILQGAVSFMIAQFLCKLLWIVPMTILISSLDPLRKLFGMAGKEHHSV